MSLATWMLLEFTVKEDKSAQGKLPVDSLQKKNEIRALSYTEQSAFSWGLGGAQGSALKRGVRRCALARHSWGKMEFSRV